MISGFGHYKFEKENPNKDKFHVPKNFQTQSDLPVEIVGGRDKSEKAAEIRVRRNSPLVQEIRELCKCLEPIDPKKKVFITRDSSEIASQRNVFPTQNSSVIKSKNQRLRSLFLNQRKRSRAPMAVYLESDWGNNTEKNSFNRTSDN